MWTAARMRAQIPLAEDQHVAQALTPQRPHEPFGIGVGRRHQLHLIQVTGTDVCG